MLTKKQIIIFRAFFDDLFEEFTFKQLKDKSGLNSNNMLQIALGKFEKLNIITIRKVGDINLYKLNLHNSLTLSFLNLVNEQVKKEIMPSGIKLIMEEIQFKISKVTVFFILGVFGSFSKKKATNKSDLDVVILVDDESQRKEIIPLIETVKRRELINIDYHIMLLDEFSEMLSADYENLSKQIRKSNLITYGYLNYISIIKGLK
jgi:predicted nucleotidyltransferase